MTKQQLEAGGGVGRPDEWIGALVTLASYVTDEGKPYRPTAVMWLETESGLVVDTELVRPEQALARAAGLFQLATREPKAGEPRVPRRLRVNDEALASALRGSVGDVELVVAATPEIDEVVESMTAYMRERAARAASGEEGEEDGDDGGDDDEVTFLEPGVQADEVAAMFAAAARLYKAAPWDLIPGDVSLAVKCDLLGIESGAMVVVGQMGQAHGFSLFSTLDDAMQFYDAVEANERGERKALPPHMMFSFDARGEMPARMVEEIDDHGWTVASNEAYPYPLMVDPDLVTRGLTRVELAGVTAIMTALAELVEAEPAELARAWDEHDDAGITWNRTVQTAMGDVNVELGAPVDVGAHGHDHQEMAAVETFENEDGELDPEIVGDYAHALLHELEEVPQIEDIQLEAAEMLILEAARSFALPVTQMTAPVLRDLLFRVLPAKHAVEPDLAVPVVDAAQLLMAYADEMLGIETAMTCRVMLSMPGLVEELAKAFAVRPAKKAAAKKKAGKKPAAKKQAAAAKAPAKKPAKPAVKKKAAAKTTGAAKKTPAKKPAKKRAAETKRR